MKRRLGPDYDAILEKDHIHVEFDPNLNRSEKWTRSTGLQG